MKKMRIAVLLVAAVLMCLLLCGAALADDTQQKKIVYVVLDDSTSMTTNQRNRWSHANYATQVLAGLMNEGDELRVYLLRQGFQDFDLTARGIQNSLNELSRKNTVGNTPFETVEKAQRTLSARTPEENAQYWLVVLTDGVYNEGYDAEKLRSIFTSYVDKGIGLSHYPMQVIYCTIGNKNDSVTLIAQTQNEIDALLEKGIYCYHAEDDFNKPDNIVAVMGEIADLISGRTRFQGAALKMIDDRTVQITADIPLFNFVVLSQNNKGSLESVTGDNGKTLNISRSASARAPRPGSGVVLSANVHTVDNGRNHIPEGKYTLRFSESVDMNKLAVLFEPAVQVKLYMDDPAQVHAGQSFTAAAKILEYGTQNVIELGQLPKGSSLKLELKNGSATEVKSGAEPEATISVVQDATMYVTGTLKIPGYRDIVAKVQFQPIPPPKVAASVSGGSDGMNGNVLTVTVETLKKQTKYMDFELVVDGKAGPSPQQMQALGLTVKTNIAHAGLTFPEKGKVRFTPCYTEGMRTGDYPLSLCNDEGEAVAEGIVRVVDSTFELKAEEPKQREVMEAAFPNAPQTFLFTLYVDGEKANADEYRQMVRFAELTKGNPLQEEIKDGKWSVTASYGQGMGPGEYPICAAVGGKAAAEVARLQVNPSSYEVVNKGEYETEVKEARFREQAQVFRFALMVDGKEVADPAAYGEVAFKVSEDALLLSRPQIDHGVYVLEAGWQEGVRCGTYTLSASFNKGAWKELAALKITESTYEWTVSPDQPVEITEWTMKDEGGVQARFALKVDGEKVKPEQMHWYQPTFRVNDTEYDAAVDGSEWVVQMEPQPVGEHRIHAMLAQKQAECELKVEVKPSQFEIEVDKKGAVTVSEARFRSEPQTFTFTLKVDGKTAEEPGKYGTFTIAEKDNKPIGLVVSEKDGGKMEAVLSYTEGMPVDAYTIRAALGNLAAKDAVLTLSASKYEFGVSGVKKNGFSFEQAAFASLKPEDFSFRFTLKEDGKKLDPALVTISGWDENMLRTEKKEDELVVYLAGDLTTPVGNHEVKLSYVSPSGTPGEQIIPVEVIASRYDIRLSSNKKADPGNMLFTSAEEFINNPEERYFDIQVGNKEKRSLSQEEMEAVTELILTGPSQSGADSAENLIRHERTDNRYTVKPQAPAGWQPSQSLLEYTITCRVKVNYKDNYSKNRDPWESSFGVKYEFIDYVVRCIGPETVELARTNLSSNEEISLQFRVFSVDSRGNEKPLGSEYVKGNVKATTDSKFGGHVSFRTEVKTEVRDDGVIVVTPRHKMGRLLGPFFQVIVPTGDMPVTLTFNNNPEDFATATVKVTFGSLLDALLPWIILITVLYIVLVTLFKKRLNWGNKLYYTNMKFSPTDQSLRTNSGEIWRKVSLKPRGFKEWTRVILPFSFYECRYVYGLKIRGTTSLFGKIFQKSRNNSIELNVNKNDRFYAVNDDVNEEDRSFDISNPVLSDYSKFKKEDGRWKRITMNQSFLEVRNGGSSARLYRFVVRQPRGRR